MRMKLFWLMVFFFIFLCHLATAEEEAKKVQLPEKVEATVPLPTMSPPEGNTTFLDGTTWCVAQSTVSQADLQNALDWACGLGMTDCSPIQNNGPCFEPDTLVSHASYAFNNYYQQNGNSEIACNFGGTAVLTRRNPSYGKCQYVMSGPPKSSGHTMQPSAWVWSRFILGLLLLFVCTKR
ncbi:glucan endo-1,3-beta-glucosidase 12 [Impatiens glandulifera]|uniref:glucan endo-1,3-beta-glucosidase 12 n=1 Tax=Impatiens glandulifera TaxID=253017 RepID=UPI001FB0A98D|nr:glucan endo-1,3-beta-glucosidase 12 [Impatiens glandulifera]